MLTAKNLTKRYRPGDREIVALGGLSCELHDGDFVVVHGPSGSGKTTLLLMLGGMLRPSGGSVHYGGTDLYAMSAAKRNAYRKECVGFVFQRFFLMPYLNVYDNIRLSLVMRGNAGDARVRITEWAERLCMAERLKHRPSELSVGEQQRVAVARALVGNPRIVLADEPTGNLDTANADIIYRCLREESQRGKIVLFVTHNERLLGIGNRRMHIRKGRPGEGER